MSTDSPAFILWRLPKAAQHSSYVSKFWSQAVGVQVLGSDLATSQLVPGAECLLSPCLTCLLSHMCTCLLGKCKAQMQSLLPPWGCCMPSCLMKLLSGRTQGPGCLQAPSILGFKMCKSFHEFTEFLMELCLTASSLPTWLFRQWPESWRGWCVPCHKGCRVLHHLEESHTVLHLTAPRDALLFQGLCGGGGGSPWFIRKLTFHWPTYNTCGKIQYS